MTVSSTTIIAGPFAGNGVSDTFSYTFGLEDKSEIKVFETDDDGVQTLLTVDTDYTVNDVGVETGGTVTRVAGALPINFEWFMHSAYQETQETEFESQGAFFPDIHEAAMDKLTRLTQQNTRTLSRAAILPDNYSGDSTANLPLPKAGYLLRWLDSEDGFENVLPADLSSVVTMDADLPKEFANIAAAVADLTLTLNKTVNTQHHTTIAGEGAGRYKVVLGGTGTPDNGFYINIDNGFQLELIDRSVANVRQFGALGDNSDATTEHQAAFNAPGITTVTIPAGDYTFSDVVIIPDNIRTVDADKSAKIVQTVNKPIFYKAGSISETSIFLTSDVEIGDELLSVDPGNLSEFAVDDWVFVRSGDLTPNVTAGSRVAMIRQVTDVSATVHIDAAAYRYMTIDVSGSLSRMAKLTLGQAITFKGGDYSAIDQTNTMTLFDILLCEDVNFNGVSIHDSGGAAIRLAHCVGGTYTDSNIFNMLDDRDNGHLGYGIQLCGATRGFQFSSGSAGKCRHGITTSSVFTTTLGFDIALPLPTTELEGRGEPEACHYGPVYVYNTTNAGLDTHEQGYGITISPNVHGCFDGVLLRCSDATVDGGQIIGCRRAGIRAEFASSNPTATVTSTYNINNTVIRDVALIGSESIGLLLEPAGAVITLDGVDVKGDILTGVDVHAGIDITIQNSRMQTSNTGLTRGILPRGEDAKLFNVELRDFDRGIDSTFSNGTTEYEHVRYVNCTADNFTTNAEQDVNGHTATHNHKLSGKYYINGHGSVKNNSLAMIHERVAVAPMYFDKPVTISEVGMHIVTPGDAGSIMNICAYSSEKGQPKYLLFETSLDGSVSGDITENVNVTLPAGQVWVGVVWQGVSTTAIDCVGNTGGDANVVAQSIGTAMNDLNCYVNTGQGTLDAVFTNIIGGEFSSELCPRIALRIA